MYRLEYELEGQERTADLPDGSHIVGRSKSCDVVIRNPSISSQHVRIDVQDNRVTFRDLLSRNGTAVNGKKTESGQIRPGDVLKLGQVETRLETDAPAAAVAPEAVADAPAAAAVAPPSEPGATGEETPVDQSFLPVAQDSAQAGGAVEVVKPVAAPSRLPAPIQKAAGGLDRKKLVYAGVGFVCVILLALLLMPTNGGDDEEENGRPRRFSYWSEVKDGVAAFERAEYAKAQKIWQDAQSNLRRHTPRGRQPNPTAGVLSRVAAPFALAMQTDPPPAVDWDSLTEDIMQLVDDRVATEIESFLHGTLLKACSDEQKASALRRAADQRFAARAFDEAEKLYAQIPVGSIYRQGVDKRLTACRDGQDTQHRERALSLHQGGRVQPAIREIEKIPAGRRTAQDKANIRQWQRDLQVRDRVDQVKRWARGNNGQRWREAMQEIERIQEQFKGHPATVELDGLEQTLERNLFYDDVQKAYERWDTDALARLDKDPLSGEGRVKAILTKAGRIQTLFEKVEKLKNDTDNVESIEEIIRTCEMIRDIEPSRDHPTNREAQSIESRYPPEKRGSLLKEKAMAAVTKKEFRKARLFFRKARDDYGMDVTVEVDQIKEKGKNLLQTGINAAIAKQPTLARERMYKALECFLPGEEGYELVQKKIGQYHLDTEEVRFQYE